MFDGGLCPRASSPRLTEAGGRFTSLEGAATPDGGSVVCTNGHLHEEVLARLHDSHR